MRSTDLKFIFLLFIFMSAPAPGQAQKMEIPARIQVATFTKIFKYVPTLRTKSQVKVLLVYDKHFQVETQKFLDAFENASVPVQAVLPEAIENFMGSIDVVYFMPGLQEYSALCKKYKKLSNAGVAKYAETGEVSIALGLVDDKPRLFINMSSLKNEGHHLSANLLKIAKVFP